MIDAPLLASSAGVLPLTGAACFGAVIGWFTYHINRYRSGDVQLGDIVTVIGAVGGGAVLTLFPAGSSLFGAYGIGLLIGFFAYLLVLVAMVRNSDQFDVNWFLDGRRKKPNDPWYVPEGARGSGTAMGDVHDPNPIR